MRFLSATCVLLLALTACGKGNEDNTREVDKRERGGGAVPTGSIDEAVRTEAHTHMYTIHQQVKIQAMRESDPSSFYQSIAGQLDGSKLQRMGVTEAQLTGRYYRPSDYTISIDGNTMTIQAAQRGTRGRVEPQQFRLP